MKIFIDIPRAEVVKSISYRIDKMIKAGAIKIACGFAVTTAVATLPRRIKAFVKGEEFCCDLA